MFFSSICTIAPETIYQLGSTWGEPTALAKSPSWFWRGDPITGKGHKQKEGKIGRKQQG